MNNTDGFCNIFDLETAGQNNTAGCGRATGEIPICGLAGSTILACPGTVQEESENVGEFIECREWQIGVDTKRFDHCERTGDARNNVRSLVSMKLGRIEAHERAERVDVGGLGVDKDADGFDFLGKLGA